jgi:hypothetical protein
MRLCGRVAVVNRLRSAGERCTTALTLTTPPRRPRVGARRPCVARPRPRSTHPRSNAGVRSATTTASARPTRGGAEAQRLGQEPLKARRGVSCRGEHGTTSTSVPPLVGVNSTRRGLERRKDTSARASPIVPGCEIIRCLTSELSLAQRTLG